MDQAWRNDGIFGLLCISPAFDRDRTSSSVTAVSFPVTSAARLSSGVAVSVVLELDEAVSDNSLRWLEMEEPTAVAAS